MSSDAINNLANAASVYIWFSIILMALVTPIILWQIVKIFRQKLD